MDRHRFFVRRESDRWSFGRDDRAFARLPTKDHALKLADRFLRQHPGAELILDDEPLESVAQAWLAARTRSGGSSAEGGSCAALAP